MVALERAQSQAALQRKVLIVDDDLALLELYQRVLENRGFVVSAASRGEHAVEFHTQLGRFDLLITDIDMPGQSGIDLAAELTSRQPDLPVLFITGGSKFVFSEVLSPRRNLLLKPFTARTLVASIDQILTSN